MEKVYLSREQVRQRYCDVSISTLERWQHEVGFPKPYKFGPGKQSAPYWDPKELDVWDVTRKEVA